jgi:hypothetical protein
VCISHLYHACYMLRPCNSPWFDHHNNNIRWSILVMKLLIMQSSPASLHFLRLGSKYYPQHPIPKHPKSIFFP